MNTKSILQFSLCGNEVQVGLSQDPVFLFKDDLLTISMEVGEGLQHPQLLAGSYAANQVSSTFSIGPGETMPLGIHLSWFQIQNGGHFLETLTYQIELSGRIKDGEGTSHDWSRSLTLNLGPEVDPNGQGPALLPDPPGRRETYTIRLRETHCSNFGPVEAYSLDDDFITLDPQDQLVLAVVPETGLDHPGFFAIDYFDNPTLTRICTLAFGANQPIPAGIAMPRFAFINHGLPLNPLGEGPRYLITFQGSVFNEAGVLLWGFDPELTLKTSIGGPGEPDPRRRRKPQR